MSKYFQSRKQEHNHRILQNDINLSKPFVLMTTEFPGSNVVNSLHLPIESPRTCIFYQVLLTASPLEAPQDQTSPPPPIINVHNMKLHMMRKHRQDIYSNTYPKMKFKTEKLSDMDFYLYYYFDTTLTVSSVCICTLHLYQHLSPE